MLGITVPEGSAFDQIDEEMEAAAAEHLNALTAEYQRRLLTDQFEAGPRFKLIRQQTPLVLRRQSVEVFSRCCFHLLIDLIKG